MGANWGYNKYDTVYKKPDMMIRNLTDVVSKGGNLLLNIGPNPQGSFPQQTEPGLNAFRQWIKTNGEAIYGTSPWHTYGETSPLAHGKREEVKEGFHDAVFDGTPVNAIPDFRYTAKGNHVYVIVRHVPAGEFTLRAFKGYTTASSASHCSTTRKPSNGSRPKKDYEFAISGALPMLSLSMCCR